MNSNWRCALELNSARSVVSGSTADLAHAIRNGGDLRVYTEWFFEEHIAPDLKNPDPAHNGLMREIIDMRETMLIADSYAAGITTLRQPIVPVIGFNPNAPNRMSYFMYGMDGQQACANLGLDDALLQAESGPDRIVQTPANMPKMSETEENARGTTGPSRNFVYEMERYRYFVRDDWTPILEHDENGNVMSGSWEALHQAHLAGREFKVGIRNLCSDLVVSGDVMPHEVFTFLGSGWLHTALKRYEVLSHPLVRVAPEIPVKYRSGRWDVSWVYLRTDGSISIRSLNPSTRKFHDWETRLACRWFAR
jgi:hypothetical protein